MNNELDAVINKSTKTQKIKKCNQQIKVRS